MERAIPKRNDCGFESHLMFISWSYNSSEIYSKVLGPPGKDSEETSWWIM